MLKQKEYNIADSNIANLGTELERNVKLASAQTEPAWDGCGKAVGLDIFRIEKFQVVPWPKEYYGSFFSGDSYIILNTYKVENKLCYNVHFWLGAHTTQDEAGTAAYKTVELDTLLGDQPVQFREVMGHESAEFAALFPKGIRIMEGGVDTGFNHVEPESFQPRLLHLKGKRKNISAIQVPVEAGSFNSGDVFLYDKGMQVFVWNGSSAGIWEKQKAAELARAIDDERKSAVEIEICTQGSDAAFPWDDFGGCPDDFPEATSDEVQVAEKKLLKISDASGSLSMEEVASGDLSRDMLTSDDVFILDAGHTIYAYVGTGASAGERKNALGMAQTYLDKSGKPAWTPICRVLEGAEAEQFYVAFN